MKKIQCMLFGLAALSLGGLLGFHAGSKYSPQSLWPARSVAFEEDKATDTVVIYSYFVGPNGERVIDGKHYTLGPTSRTVKTYRDGALQGVSSTSIHY